MGLVGHVVGGATRPGTQRAPWPLRGRVLLVAGDGVHAERAGGEGGLRIKRALIQKRDEVLLEHAIHGPPESPPTFPAA
ncbi:hypothetical protein B0H14DRAFT_3421621 [Mycena olivaceomarginata]|nr:hypothetical protein B0H14DRAFT_3421621 [Mycena olivaceomarginata]